MVKPLLSTLFVLGCAAIGMEEVALLIVAFVIYGKGGLYD